MKLTCHSPNQQIELIYLIIFTCILFAEVCFTAKYTEYSKMSPKVLLLGGSHEIKAPSKAFEIFMADGAPGNPGRHVLKAATYQKIKFIS